MSEFFRVSHDDGLDKKVIVARNKYEALGYYLIEVLKDTEIMDEIDDIELLPPDHSVEVSCIGWPECKSLLEIYKEKECGDIPQVVVSLE